MEGQLGSASTVGNPWRGATFDLVIAIRSAGVLGLFGLRQGPGKGFVSRVVPPGVSMALRPRGDHLAAITGLDVSPLIRR